MHIIKRTITPKPFMVSSVFQGRGGLELTLGLNSVFPFSCNVHREEDRPKYTDDSNDSCMFP